jgi:hypothetical protein
VVARGERWQAQLYYGGKKHTLGSFDTKQEAPQAAIKNMMRLGVGKLLMLPRVRSQ